MAKITITKKEFESICSSNKVLESKITEFNSNLDIQNKEEEALKSKIKLSETELTVKMKEKEEIYEFMKQAKDVSMRTFVKAAGFKMAGLPNWKRMAERYL